MLVFLSIDCDVVSAPEIVLPPFGFRLSSRAASDESSWQKRHGKIGCSSLGSVRMRSFTHSSHKEWGQECGFEKGCRVLAQVIGSLQMWHKSWSSRLSLWLFVLIPGCSFGCFVHILQISEAPDCSRIRNSKENRLYLFCTCTLSFGVSPSAFHCRLLITSKANVVINFVLALWHNATFMPL